MTDIMWICVAIIFSLAEARSQDPGITKSTSVNSSTLEPTPKHYAVRNISFNLGREANLTCGTKTWNETIFVVWNMVLKSKVCRLGLNNDGTVDNSCKDGKSIQNTSNAQSYLHIPDFSDKDVGVYTCDSVYKGGNDNYKINVAITVPPNTTLRLDHKERIKVAVCVAEGGKPAANMSWSHAGNVSTVETQDQQGFFTVESRLELTKGMDLQNLSCIIRHPYWTEETILTLKSQKGSGYLPFLCTAVVVVIVVFMAFLFFAQKKLLMLRRCKQSDVSPSKSLQIEDVEEVEPYASYIQRVNSIYN